MAKQTVIREDRLGMWTVTYRDGADQLNSVAEAEAAAKQAGASDVIVEPCRAGDVPTR